MINTNLGAANRLQAAALEADLAWIASQNGGYYLLGHHPDVVQNPAILPAQYCARCHGGQVRKAAGRDRGRSSRNPLIRLYYSMFFTVRPRDTLVRRLIAS